MRIDLLVNPLPLQEAKGEFSATEPGAETPAGLFLTLMAQIGAMLESAQPQPCSVGKGPEPAGEPERFGSGKNNEDAAIAAESWTPAAPAAAATAEVPPMPVAELPEISGRKESAPAAALELVTLPSPLSAPLEIPAADHSLERAPRFPLGPVDIRTQAAPAFRTPAYHPVILTALKAFVASEAGVPVAKSVPADLEGAPAAECLEPPSTPGAVEASLDVSPAVQDPDDGKQAAPGIQEQVLALPPDAGPERAIAGDERAAAGPGAFLKKGDSVPVPRTFQASVADAARPPAEPAAPGRSETEQTVRRTPFVSAPEPPAARDSDPNDAGGEPQSEMPAAHSFGRRSARPAPEARGAESAHQPVAPQHEGKSGAAPGHAPLPDGERRMVEPAAGKKPEARETVPGPQTIQEGKTVAGPRQAAPPPPVRNQDFLIQLAERIRVEADRGGDGIRIQLKPANLGRLEINAETGAAGVVARIVTESGAVRQLLEGNVQVLEQALQEQGLRVERIDFITQDAPDFRQSMGNHNGGPGAGHGTGGSDPHASRTATLRDAEPIELDPATLVALGPNSTFHAVA